MGLLRLFDPRVLTASAPRQGTARAVATLAHAHGEAVRRDPDASIAELNARRRVQRGAHDAVWVNYGPTVAGTRGALGAEAADKSTPKARHDLIRVALRDSEQREFAGLPAREVESLPSTAGSSMR
jgi:hypothetical protein